MNTTDAVNDVLRATLLSSSEGRVELGIPGTDYRIALVPTASVASPVGRKIRGRVEGRALRVHVTSGGGTFIEPLDGTPRIVQGMVIDVDRTRRRLLLDAGVPMWVTLDADRSTDGFPVGALVNFYMESGATFTPA
ncbi:MAG: hypothetical protein U0575_02570 [Phycisphaerales bacterium]